MYDDVMTRNDDGELAVRTVSATEGTNPSSYDDVFTRDSNGKLALRVVGAGGGDSHNKGYFATQAALEEAYPTAEAGDWAIVGSTDTVWLWDTDNSEWVDSDQKGQVTSVNGQTGAVTVSEVPSQTGYSGRVLGTDGFVAGWVVPEKVQRSTMPQASEEEVNNIYQFVGTTDANYTNGYFYKCVSDGQDPATYSWTRVEVQPAGATYTAGNGISIDANNEISVAAPTLTNKATGTDSVTVAGVGTSQAHAVNIGVASQVQANGVAVGRNSAAFGDGAIAVGYEAQLIGGVSSVAIGKQARVTAANAIQLGSSGVYGNQTNSDANTMKVANANGNYEIMSADGTIPADRLTHAINKYSTMPTASASNEGWIVQFTGTTDSTYTHGHLYECVSDGADPATYSWTEVSMGGGGSSYTAGTGIDITNDVISATIPFAEETTSTTLPQVLVGSQATPSNLAIGRGSVAGANGLIYSGWGCVAVGENANAGGSNSFSFASTAVGTGATAGQNGIAIGTNSTSGSVLSVAIGTRTTSADGGIIIGSSNSSQVGSSGTFSVVLSESINYAWQEHKYDLLNIDGTIPEARLADTTNAQQGDVLTLDSNGNAVWQAGGGGGLPSQTGNAGKFLITDGTSASWTDTLPDITTYYIGQASIFGNGAWLSINNSALDVGTNGIESDVIHRHYGSSTGNTEIGVSEYPFGNIYVEKINHGGNGDGDINVPTTAGTMVVADYTGASQGDVLTLNSNGNAVWAAPSGGMSSISVTLPAADWSSSTQTVTATGVTASNTVIIGAAPASTAEYNTCGVICTAQGTNSLTFTCTSTPTNDLTVTVLILA